MKTKIYLFDINTRRYLSDSYNYLSNLPTNATKVEPIGTLPHNHSFYWEGNTWVIKDDTHLNAKVTNLTKREFLKLIIALTEQTTGMTPITLEMIESYVDTAPSEVRLEWEYATFIERSHPMLDVAAEAFGISPELLDVMYANSYILLKKLDAGEPISS